MVAVVMVVAIIVVIVMPVGIRDRSRRVAEMRLDGKMEWNEIDMEREQQRSKPTPPPARVIW